jgi:CHAT domain-containing protein/Tfp pilus assembly protein PilF
MGNYAEAEPLLKEALRTRLKIFGREHPDTATSLTNLAGIYILIGDYTKAEPLFKEALEIRQRMLGPEHPDTATSLNNLADLYEDIGDYAKAEPLLKEALEIYDKIVGREHRLTATTLSNLAVLYQRKGDYANAEALFKEALAIRQKILGARHPDTALILSGLADLFTTMGDYAKAEPLRKESQEDFEKVLGQDHPLTVIGLQKLTVLELNLGNLAEANRLSQPACSAGIRALSQVLSFGSEEQRLALERLFNPYTIFAACNQTDAQLAEAVLRYKGVVLDSIIEDRLLAETSKDEANRNLIEQLKVKKRALAQLSLRTSGAAPKEAAAHIDALEQELEKIEAKLARQIRDLGQARRALTVTANQVEGAIPHDAVLIEYVRYSHYLGKSKFDSRYAAIRLSPDSPPRWLPLGGSKEIEAALRRYQALARTPDASDDEMATLLQKLYLKVWEPVERTLSDTVKTVIISPDAQLNFLSFATLLDEEKRFVAEKYSIRYIASGRDLLRELAPSPNDQIIVLANPTFDQETSVQIAKSDPPTEGSGVIRGTEKRDLEDLSFEELRGTQRENDQLLGQFKGWGWPAESYTGAQATKQVLMELHGPHILHLATHGFFEPEDPVSEPNDPESLNFSLTRTVFFKNPMHRSGLALTGANSTLKAWEHGDAPLREQDGILTAEDVSTLDLKGTWLVTLSACDTGSGEARAGEGVMGLRRGFIEAGAQNLLMSLWSISDETTVQIMSDFYETLYKTGNPPQALATVQHNWLVKLREEQGLAKAVALAGPFIMSFQGKP